MRLSKFNIMEPDLPEKGQTAVYNTLTRGMVVLNDEIIKGLEGGHAAGLSPEELKSLEDMGVLVPEGIDEDRLFDLFYNQIRFKSRTLDVTLLTTMNCNFACSYCYEGDLTRGKKRMSLETAEETISWMKARAIENNVARIEIQYHGGEPLMNVPVIEKVGREMVSFCEENNIKFRSHIVTNGYLLDKEMAERMKAVGVGSVKITVDGPEEVHDSMRYLTGGGATYRTIMKNILEVKDLLGISLGGNYTKETKDRIPELLDELLDAGIGPKDLRMVAFHPVMPVEAKLKSAAFDSNCIPLEELYEEGIKITEEVLKRGFWKYQEPEMNPCPVVMATHFTINWDGDVCKCPALADHPEYSVGHVSRDLVYNAEMYRSLGCNTFDNKKCRDCAVLPFCLAGCRYLSLINSGEFHGMDCRKKAVEALARDAVRRMVREA